MGNPAQYYNPIIQAMLAHQQQVGEAARMKQGAQQFKQEQALREQQQADLESQVGKEFDLREQELAAQNQANKLALLRGIQEGVAGGISPEVFKQNFPELLKSLPNAGSGAQPQQPQPQIPLLPYRNQPQQPNIQSPQASNQPLPNGQPPVNGQPNNYGFSTPEQLLQRQVQAARAIASAQAQGALPARLTEMDRQNQYQTARDATQNQFDLHRLNAQQVFEASQNALNRTNQLNIANVSRGTQMAIANLDAGVKREQIGAEYGLDPSAASGLALDIFGGGQKADINNPVMRRLVATGESQGLKNPGTDIDQLKTLDKAESALGNYEDFVNKYLSNSKIGAMGTAIQGKLPIATDAKAAEEGLSASLQAIGHELEGFPNARPLSGQFAAESTSTPNLSDTKKTGMQKVNNLKNQIDKQRQSILKNYSPQQIEMFKQQNPGLNLPAVPAKQQQSATGNKQVNWSDVQ